VKLSILIVSWNTRTLLEQCLASIYTPAPPFPFEVLIVDNASSDGSPAMIRERFPQAKLIENRDNPGFARANNQAIHRSAGEYVLLLNPDTIVRPGGLAELVRFLDERPEAGAAGPRLLNPDGTLQVSAFPRPTLFREFWFLFHLDRFYPLARYPLSRWGGEEPKEVEILMGACLLLRRKVLDQVGPLDEDFFIYSEEVDLCTRVRRGGWRLYWTPRAEVVHYGGQSTQQVAAEMFLRLYQGKILYFRKHQGPLAVLAYKAILFLASLGRLALTPFVLLEKSPQRQKHLVLSDHYRRLLWSLPGF
jgi:GT2 family glycosyltransferase